jgi:hypothetical protein
MDGGTMAYLPQGQIRLASTRAGTHAVDEELLLTVARYHYVTTELTTWLLDYSASSYKYVLKRLKRLSDAGYLLHLQLPTISAGKPQLVYTLSTRGGKLLESMGYEVSGRTHPSDHGEHSLLFLQHTLACNRVLGAAELVARRHHEVVIAQMIHERDLRHRPVRVSVAGGQLAVINDGFLEMHLANKHKMAIGWELDRGTVDQRAVRRKLAGLVSFVQGPAQEAFDCPAPVIAFATTAGPQRMNLLRRWCEDVLKDARREVDSSLFLFTAIPDGPVDADTLYLKPVFYEPFVNQPVPLLEWN